MGAGPVLLLRAPGRCVRAHTPPPAPSRSSSGCGSSSSSALTAPVGGAGGGGAITDPSLTPVEPRDLASGLSKRRVPKGRSLQVRIPRLPAGRTEASGPPGACAAGPRHRTKFSFTRACSPWHI